jgi:hypothetical protein
LVSASGGIGGINVVTAVFPRYESGVEGATTAVGQITQVGGPSIPFAAHGIALRQAIHGAGGSSFFGPGREQSRTGGNPGSSQAGLSGVNYGSGGGASYAQASCTSGAVGGAGANGIVIVELYA